MYILLFMSYITSTCLYNISKWFFSIRIVDIRNRLPFNVVNISNVMCLEKRLDKCWADLNIKLDHEAPLNYSGLNYLGLNYLGLNYLGLNYSGLNYSKISKSQNIDFDGELSVESNAI